MEGLNTRMQILILYFGKELSYTVGIPSFLVHLVLYHSSNKTLQFGSKEGGAELCRVNTSGLAS